MSQRDSGYARIERDAYETPEWVTLALVPQLPFMNTRTIWEPACGSGKMLRALRSRGISVYGSDVTDGLDFLKTTETETDAIITNPPYELASEFCTHAIALMQSHKGLVAMLLRTDFDHAKTRQHLFGGCPQFAKKLVLTKRIQWFEHSTASPSFNHAWFIWDWKHNGPPVLAYGPN